MNLGRAGDFSEEAPESPSNLTSNSWEISHVWEDVVIHTTLSQLHGRKPFGPKPPGTLWGLGTPKKSDLPFYAFGDGNAVHGNELCQLCQGKDISDFLAEF